MYRLDAALGAALAAGRTIIVPNRQRAAAVRLAYAWVQRAAGNLVWATPDVIAWDAWLARELLRVRQLRGSGSVFLNVSQQHVLWQTVLASLADSAERAEFLQSHADAIAAAARLTREWRLEWSATGVPEEALLLARALQRMDEYCHERGAFIPALARTDQLMQLEPTSLAFAGFHSLTPRQQEVAELFARAGRTVSHLRHAEQAAAPRAVSYPNAAAEFAAMGAWCRARLDAEPESRLLIIYTDPRTRPAVIREAIADALDPLREDAAARGLVALEGGQPLLHQPLVAAGIALSRLGAEELDYGLLGSVLLSPFFDLGPEGDRVRLDLWLRRRLPQRAARADIVAQLLKVAEPLDAVATRLLGVLTAVENCWRAGRARPFEWAFRLTAALRAAGHPGTRPLTSEETQAWQRWLAAVEEFASLDALVEPMGVEAALGRLEALLNRVQHQAATGDAAVTVTSWRDDPIVGYDGIWVGGLGEMQSPEPPRPDAFIPLATQRSAALPQVSSTTRLAAARLQYANWAARAGGELVLSYPRVEGDLEVAPSILLQHLRIEPQANDRRPWLALGQATSELSELALPPIVAPGLLRAGSRLPELQRECPFRAQAELRLGAEGLVEPRIGIDPRLRGTLLHRALDLLWQRIGSSAALRSRPLEAWLPEIDAALVRTLEAGEWAYGAPPTARELDREKDRCRDLLLEALKLEARRGMDFQIEAGERQLVWPVANANLNLRIDRVDRLQGGGRVVIDYKTGSRAALDLIGDNARPVQLLAYLDALEGESRTGDISALALLKLVPGKSEFRAAEDGRAQLPVPRSSRQSALPWAEQVALWRADVRGLVARHIDGDARVQPLPRACEYCKLPALCRIDAQQLNATLDAAATDDGVDLDGVGGADE